MNRCNLDKSKQEAIISDFCNLLEGKKKSDLNLMWQLLHIQNCEACQNAVKQRIAKEIKIF